MTAVLDTRLTNDIPSYEVRYVESHKELCIALDIEDEVFREKHFLPVGKLYVPYMPQSFVIGAFTADGACLGISRMIESRPLLPPILNDSHHVAITSEPDKWRRLAEAGLFDEFATIAVPQRYRGSDVMLDLVRFGYRHARHITNGNFGGRPSVGYISAILSPGVAWGLRLKWHFPLCQVGPKQHYMDQTEYREDVLTAPYVLDLNVMEERMHMDSPEYFSWMRNAPMTDHHPPPLPLLRRDSPVLAGCTPLDDNKGEGSSG